MDNISTKSDQNLRKLRKRPATLTVSEQIENFKTCKMNCINLEMLSLDNIYVEKLPISPVAPPPSPDLKNRRLTISPILNLTNTEDLEMFNTNNLSTGLLSIKTSVNPQLSSFLELNENSNCSSSSLTYSTNSATTSSSSAYFSTSENDNRLSPLDQILNFQNRMNS